MAVVTKFLTNSNGKMLVDSTTGKPLSLTIDVVDGLSIRLAERAAVSTTYSTFASYSTTSQTYSNITNASEFAVGDVAILQWTITDRDNTVGIIFAEVSAVSSNSITAKGLGMAVKGDSGEDGAQIELRAADGQLQWKYDNQDSWTVLAELSDLSALTYTTIWSAPSVPFEGLEIGLHTIYFNRSPQVDDSVTVAMGGSPNFDDTKGRSWIAVCKINGQAHGNETVTAAIITKVVETTGEKGNPGKDGDDGKAATIRIGTVTTGAAGSQAAVTNTGTANEAVIDFVIPQGEQGADGVGIPAGGTVGQVLRKAGAEDYACEWAEPAGVDIVDIGTVADLVFGNEGTGAVNISDELYNRLMVVGGVIMKFTTSDNQEVYLNGMVKGSGVVYAGTFGGGGVVMIYYGHPMSGTQKRVQIVATAIKYNEFATTSGTYPNMTVGKATNATNATNATTASKLSGLTSFRSTINLSSGQVTSDSLKYLTSLLAFFGGGCIGATASVDDGRATSFLIGRNSEELIAFFDESNNGVKLAADGAQQYGSFNMSGELTLNIVTLADATNKMQTTAAQSSQNSSIARRIAQMQATKLAERVDTNE